jgi:hypothetical protein
LAARRLINWRAHEALAPRHRPHPLMPIRVRWRRLNNRKFEIAS